MTPTVAVPTLEHQFEDPLAYLPCSSIVAYTKGQIIYTQDQPSTSLCLVIDGKVKISRSSEDGRQALVDIYHPDEFFGESAFLRLEHCGEQATALENTKIMTWTASVIEEIIMRRPRLAVALLQILVQRSVEYNQRIESFGLENIACRLARALIRFSGRLGTLEEDGSVRLMPLTHELLSQYVGTSRELVTTSMNQFRQQGHVRYSRKGIILNRQSLRESVLQNAERRGAQALAASLERSEPAPPSRGFDDNVDGNASDDSVNYVVPLARVSNASAI